MVKRQRTILGIVIREVRRKMAATADNAVALTALNTWLERAERILSAQMEQSTNLLQDLGVSATQAVVNPGFRGKEMDQASPDLEIIHRGRIKTMTKAQRRWLKRRQAVEPAIGHLKSDNRMQRCWLQGATGDALHALCCALGYNLRWLMRAVVRLSLKGLLLCLFWLVYWARFAASSLTQAATVTGSASMGTDLALSAPGFNR